MIAPIDSDKFCSEKSSPNSKKDKLTAHKPQPPLPS